MGVLDAGAAAMGGMMDWPQAFGTIDHLRNLVKKAQMPDAVVHEGAELFGVKPHLADPKQLLFAELDRAYEMVDDATQICYQVLEAL